MDSINLHGVVKIQIGRKLVCGDNNETTYRKVTFWKEAVPGEGSQGICVTVFDDVPVVED